TVPAGAQEFEIVGAVYLERGVEPMFLGRHDIGKSRALHGLKDPLGTERPLEWLDQDAAVQLGLGVAQLVLFGINDPHDCRRSLVVSYRQVTSSPPARQDGCTGFPVG